MCFLLPLLLTRPRVSLKKLLILVSIISPFLHLSEFPDPAGQKARNVRRVERGREV